MDSKAKLVASEEQAMREIRAFQDEGYAQKEIHVLAHDNQTSVGLAELMKMNSAGLYEEAVTDFSVNLFRSKGDQLRSKMHALGLSKAETDHFERELEKGKILVLVWFDDTHDDFLESHLNALRRNEKVLIPPAGIYLSDRSGRQGRDIW